MRWLTVLLLCLATMGAAQTLPDPVRDTVTDHADLLTDTEEADLHDRLRALNAELGVQMAVVTLPSQAAYAPDAALEKFATDLFNGWGIGDANRNNGILVLILRDDRAIRIELGAAYGRDWDRVAANVINRSFLPAFEAEDYTTGIVTGVEDITESIARPFSTGADAPVLDNSIMNWMAIIAFVGAALVVMRRRFANMAMRFERCPNCGARALSRAVQTNRKATASKDGEGERITTCSQCAYRDSTRFRIAARDTRHSTSGRGGFGGGRSGGGGASGRW